jgi:hypothetical protein
MPCASPSVSCLGWLCDSAPRPKGQVDFFNRQLERVNDLFPCFQQNGGRFFTALMNYKIDLRRCLNRCMNSASINFRGAQIDTTGGKSTMQFRDLLTARAQKGGEQKDRLPSQWDEALDFSNWPARNSGGGAGHDEHPWRLTQQQSSGCLTVRELAQTWSKKW